jgi:hypothetical protein
MDWTVYWFQSIACFLFAGVAMFSGITGAASRAKAWRRCREPDRLGRPREDVGGYVSTAVKPA